MILKRKLTSKFVFLFKFKIFRDKNNFKTTIEDFLNSHTIKNETESTELKIENTEISEII